MLLTIIGFNVSMKIFEFHLCLFSSLSNSQKIHDERIITMLLTKQPMATLLTKYCLKTHYIPPLQTISGFFPLISRLTKKIMDVIMNVKVNVRNHRLFVFLNNSNKVS